MKRSPKSTSDDTRVTADLPRTEYTNLSAVRKSNKASTTDVFRALLRLQERDPDLARRLTEEISQIRIEALEAALAEQRQEAEAVAA